MATGVFLAGTLDASFERVMWMLISQKGDTQYSTFLSLAHSTGITGLLALVMSKGHSVVAAARLVSIVPLLALLLIPVVGVLIMSKSVSL